MKKHKVKQGETFYSIAEENGFAGIKVIMDAPENSNLRDQRPAANILLPGDEVAIPDPRPCTESLATDQKHSFKRLFPKRLLRIRFVNDFGEPLSESKYVLTLGEERREAQTNDKGEIEEKISYRLKSATLEIAGAEYQLDLSHLDPVTSVSGIQSRLNNLGFYCGRVDGTLGPRTRAALSDFQRSENDLSVEKFGEPEQDTIHRLSERHEGLNTAGKDELRGEIKPADISSVSEAQGDAEPATVESEAADEEEGELTGDDEDFLEHPPHDEEIV
jgi:N-acetylmuramoyl-L-alanine amidase